MDLGSWTLLSLSTTSILVSTGRNNTTGTEGVALKILVEGVFNWPNRDS